ncbi:MAG: heavy metal translocating P-type ATPase [Zoogloeaceae bacterium]|jgi:heavy metal translocating P-type ATPase|nr:heavy metal translocating P-type ATPase [Zoogloeaceae bacterium]
MKQGGLDAAREGAFLALHPVHVIAQGDTGRVRFRYRLRPGVSCAAAQTWIAALPAVRLARFNGKANSLVIEFDPAGIHVDGLRSLLLNLPAQPAVAPSAVAAEDALSRRGVALTLLNLIASGQLPAALRLPLGLAVALPLGKKAVADFRANGMTSHVLEAIAVAISLARRDFTAANTTTFMLALGEYLEESIARRSDALLKHLLRPHSDTVWVLRDGEEIAVHANEVKTGDSVVVATGGIISVDGTVLSGEASVNEAAMTGESAAVRKERGHRALSGTIVEEGRLIIYAEQVGAATTVARIADYVERSLTTKSATQISAAALADRLVPTVLKLAGASWLVSGDWRRAAAVLQADYSCALKLAIPVAFKSAMYSAGRQNILIKGADALERLAEADTLIFDKTGTLTSGDLEVTDAITFDADFSPEELIWLAASVEEHYFHPLALAVVAAAHTIHGRHFAHNEVEFVVAHGVTSVIEGKRVVVGSRHFIEQHEHIDTSPWSAEIGRLYGEGKTLLYIGYGGRLSGVLALKDHVRPESRDVVARLRALGVKRLLMLTGDHASRAHELADALGLDGFHAELLPEEKAGIVEKLKKTGAKIAFVGDGINDAPALAAAHVGIAMQKGADVARLTADIVLLEDGIESVVTAKNIANAVMRRIDANYKLTLGLNTGILSAAALGLLSPVAATILHNGSTLGILTLASLRATPPKDDTKPPRARRLPRRA